MSNDNPTAAPSPQQAVAPIFDRRWSLARDGFGLQRDDENGNYVHIDDAIDVLHAALAPQAVSELPAGAAAPSMTKWQHTTEPLHIRLGKTGEELGELASVVSRCLIQGVDAIDPSCGKSNRQRLIDETADVRAQLNCNDRAFGLPVAEINARVAKKEAWMAEWESHYDATPTHQAAEPTQAQGSATPGWEWISCADDLPQLGQIVLGWDGGLGVFSRDDQGDDGWLWARQNYAWNLADPMGIECDEDYQVTHWMPLPAAPGTATPSARDGDARDAARYRWLRDNKNGRRVSTCALAWTPTALQVDIVIDELISLGEDPAVEEWKEAVDVGLKRAAIAASAQGEKP